jgi:cytochrome c oxidase subunit 2
MSSKVTATLLGLLGLAFYSGMGIAAGDPYQLNFQEPQSIIARETYDQHIVAMWVCVGIFVVVFGAMLYSLIYHRKSVGYKAANFHHSTTVEIIWTIIPFFILIGMAYPATKTIIAMKDTSSPDITVKVTGYQWQWGYDYLVGEGSGISFISKTSTPLSQIYNKEAKGEHYLLEVDNPLVVPIGKKVRLLITANDVLHAWWVPAFAVKQDAIPGFIRDAWFTADKVGTYRGSCVELCGKDHAFMPIVVEVMEPAKYAQWVAEQKAKTAKTTVDVNKVFTMDELKAEGEKVYAGNCVACHQANGKGIPGAFAALDGSNIANGPIEEHIGMVLNGKVNTAMAAYKHLSDVDVAAVVTYERNAWGNTKGDLIQPSEINRFRK